ncbi:hypothetical protein E4T43_05435 [Aureobasidium subglaciale]|nr:hypothetical protein E4T43_05435 [Aureobasidium subglaciale]
MTNHVTHHALELYAASLPGCSSGQQKLFNELITTLHKQELQSLAAQHHATPAQQNVSAQHHTTPAQQNVSAQHHATPAQQNVSAQHHATPAQQSVSAQHHATPAQQSVSAQHHAIMQIRLEHFDRSKQVLAIDSLPNRRVVNKIVAKVAEPAEAFEDLEEAELESLYDYRGSDCSSVNGPEQVPVNKYIDDTFADRAEDDAAKHSLKEFCPVSLSYNNKRCPHGDRCALKKVCHFNPGCRKDDCKFSHEVVVTCPFMLRKGHCSRKDCKYNHDHEVRSIIQMFAKDHVDGVHGLIDEGSSAEAVAAHMEEVSAEADTAQVNETSVEV